jgi:hypothetical protein
MSEVIKKAAEELGLEYAVVAAVCEVESSGVGFLPDGRPKILFEGHIFYKELKKAGINPERYTQIYPNIVYPKWDKGQYRGRSEEWVRLGWAESIHKEAALKSASWGAYQIMGFNYSLFGYSDVAKFVDAQYTEEGQVLSFVRFIKASQLDELLRAKDWAGFACAYNGTGYKENQYDKKLAAAYKKAGGK